MANLDKKQKNKGTWGGARPGGGRPKGSKNKLVIADFLTPEEIDKLVEAVKNKVFVDNDKEMIKFLSEQIFGKATQRQEHSGADGQPLVVALAEAIAKKHDINTDSETERDS